MYMDVWLTRLQQNNFYWICLASAFDLVHETLYSRLQYRINVNDNAIWFVIAQQKKWRPSSVVSYSVLIREKLNIQIR